MNQTIAAFLSSGGTTLVVAVLAVVAFLAMNVGEGEGDPIAKLVEEGFKRVNGEMAAMATKVQGLERVIQEGRNGNVVDLPGVDPKSFSFARAIQAIRNRDWSRAGYEREVFLASDKKRTGQTAMSDPAGSYLVPVQIAGPFIEILRARQIVKALGARMLTGLASANVRIPSQTNASTASWLGTDSTAADETEVKFGQKQLTPKKIGALARIDNSLLRMDQIEMIEPLVRDDLAQQIGLAVDYAYLFGDGSEGKPLGLYNTPGIDKTTVAIGNDGGDFSFFHALSLEGVVEDGNGLTQGAPTGFAMHPKIKRVLKKERIAQYSGDAGGAYIVPPIIKDDQLKEMLGHAFACSTQIPVNLVKGNSADCSPVIFGGDWSQLVIGVWANLEILASQEEGDSFKKDQTAIRAIMETDSLVRRTAHFAACRDARVNNA